jgi:hypothetical protein
MHRNYTSGYHSNNGIRYNRIANIKTKTHYVVEEEYGDNLKVNVYNLNEFSVSNKERKYNNSNNSNNFKINLDDCYDYDDYSDYGEY